MWWTPADKRHRPGHMESAHDPGAQRKLARSRTGGEPQRIGELAPLVLRTLATRAPGAEAHRLSSLAAAVEPAWRHAA